MLIKIKHKLSFAFIATGLISMSIIALLGYHYAKKAITEDITTKLTVIRNSKQQEIKNYFLKLENLAKCIASNKVTTDAFLSFNTAFEKLKNSKYDTTFLLNLTRERNNIFYKKYQSKMNRIGIDEDNYINHLPNNSEALILQTLFNSTNQLPSENLSSYLEAIHNFDTVFKSFVHYTDFGGLVILNSETGDIIYTLNKSTDLGGNIYKDSLAKTNLANLFHELKKETSLKVKVADYANYFPADHTLRAFIGCPIIKNGKNIGVLALRLPIDSVDKIMTFDRKWEQNGLGKTGETYLFGNKLRLRSQSRFYLENPKGFIELMKSQGYSQREIDELKLKQNSLLNVRIESKATTEAIRGKTNTEVIKDYRGIEVISAYMPADIPGFHWGICAEIDVSEAFNNITILKRFTIYGVIWIVLTILIISLLIADYFTKPITRLTFAAKNISEGEFNNLINVKNTDEIGILADSFRTMQQKIVDLIANLRLLNNNLEEKQKEIVDSIKYARNIQNNILAGENFLEEHLEEHFVYFNPKDVVSGDFYWATANEHGFYLAVCDSTGHGVPGAFMSLLNVSFLNEAINIKNITSPDLILNEVRDSLIQTISNEENKDGMDGVLLRINKNSKKIHYAGAFNKPILIRNDTIINCEVDKMPIGKGVKSNLFTLHEIEYEPGDMLYLLSDGFPDQFGGTLNKKYKIKKLNEFLLSIYELPAKKQKEILSNEFNSWKGENEQVDDVIIFGIRF